jgi:hypothetical protein
MLLGAAVIVLLVLGSRMLPRGFAMADRLQEFMSHAAPASRGMIRAWIASAVWVFLVAARNGHILEAASIRRLPFTSAQRTHARLLASAIDYEWLFFLIGFGVAPIFVAGFFTGAHGFAAIHAAVGLVPLWLGAMALREIGGPTVAFLGRNRAAHRGAALLAFVYHVALAAVLVRHVIAVRSGTASWFHDLPALWPPVWWSRGVEAGANGQYIMALLWHGLVVIFAVLLFTAAGRLSSWADSQRRTSETANRTSRRVHHRSRILGRLPAGPVAASFGKELLALRRDPLVGSAYTGALILPLLLLGWIVLGRASVMEWKDQAFYLLAIVAAFALGCAKGSSFALERAGIAILRQLPAPLHRVTLGLDLLQWLVAAVCITVMLIIASLALGTSPIMFIAWVTSLVLTWGFLGVQHLVARLAPFHHERANDWFEAPLVTSLTTMLLASAVLAPVLLAYGAWGAGAGVIAALFMSAVSYRLGVQVSKQVS